MPTTRISNALVDFSVKETWLIAAAFVLGMGVVESGFGRRITYKVMSIKVFTKMSRNVGGNNAMSMHSNDMENKGGFDKKLLMIILGLIAMARIMLMPTPAVLSVAGQRIIAIMVFTVFMWITEAIPYNVSAIALVFLAILGLGFSPAQGE